MPKLRVESETPKLSASFATGMWLISCGIGAQRGGNSREVVVKRSRGKKKKSAKEKPPAPPENRRMRAVVELPSGRRTVTKPAVA